MFEVYNKRTGKIESTGDTRHQAWRAFCDDVNTFADNIEEFKTLMTARGFSSRKSQS